MNGGKIINALTDAHSYGVALGEKETDDPIQIARAGLSPIFGKGRIQHKVLHDWLQSPMVVIALASTPQGGHQCRPRDQGVWLVMVIILTQVVKGYALNRGPVGILAGRHDLGAQV